MSIEKTYIQYGVPSVWANEYKLIGISAATFKKTSKKNLVGKFGIPMIQVDFVKNCIVRQPLDEVIVQNLLENNGFACCLCKDQKNDGYIIHHIVEYSKTKDNSYNNLALLCPNHHDLAHRSGIALTNKISEKQIRVAKKNWEEQVKKSGKRKPGNNATILKSSDWKNTIPFKELQSYTENDKEYFFGRNKEIEELLVKIFKYNIVGLFGESGTGKTSLINAGIIPNLKSEAFISISVRCLDDPIKRIREELYKSLKECGIGSQIIEELATIDTFSHLIILLRAIMEKENRSIIIIIDQFEEIFTRAREVERESLSKGIIESLTTSSGKGKIYFLLSLREDYIGDLWDWSHLYNLEDAWIHQYRIKRLDEKKAFEAIIEPLHKLGIKVDEKFILQLIFELKKIGDGLIYPPYLQIVCSALFEEYKKQNSNSKPLIDFGHNLINGTNCTESIIADYLSESMLNGLTEVEKVNAQNILDLLTGPEGLRTFLNIEEISKYILITETSIQHVIEHLIKKKIVHPIVENDSVIGYELVHDFLSKKFFEKLGPEAQRAKTTIELFRKAFIDWKQLGVLASKDRLEILYPNFQELILDDEKWTFLIKSSFSVYWNHENKWIKIVDPERLLKICLSLTDDKDDRIIERSISTLGESKDKRVIPKLIEIIETSESSVSVKQNAIHQFCYSVMDKEILNILKPIIKNDYNLKLRKSAVHAFGRNLNELSKSDNKIIDKELYVIFKALNDSMTQVRKEAADVLSYLIVNEKSTKPLIERLKKEISISSRKAIVSALGSSLKKGYSKELISPILRKISSDNDEDYRVREEARNVLPNI